MHKAFALLVRIAQSAFAPSVKTVLWLLRIMLPISLGVRLLQYFGVLEWMAQYFHPLFVLLGLPGEGAIVFLTTASVTTYAGIAVMLSMELTLREATILSIMGCLCHALFLESAVVRKVGSNPLVMACLRIAAAFVAAVLLNLFLPQSLSATLLSSSPLSSASSLWQVLQTWCFDSLKLSLMIALLIYGLMVLQRIMDDCGVMYKLIRPLRPLMRICGLPSNVAYLWIVGNVLGISYGSAMMLDLEESGAISKEEANEVNYHLIMNHSMLEDTLVYASIGISGPLILLVRIAFALVLVWSRKALLCIAQVK